MTGDPIGSADGKREISAYDIDLAGWFRVARAHYRAVWLPMLGYSVVVVLANVPAALVPISVLLLLLVDAGLQAGVFCVAFDELRGRPWSFGRFFAGFGTPYWGRFLVFLLLVAMMLLVAMVPTLLVALVFYVFHLSDMFKRIDILEFFPFVFASANAIAAGLLLCARCFFCVGLMIEGGLRPLSAIKESWHLSQGRFWGLVGAVAVLVLMPPVTIAVLAVALLELCHVLNLEPVLRLAVLTLLGIVWVLVTPLIILTMCAGYLSVRGAKPKA